MAVNCDIRECQHRLWGLGSGCDGFDGLPRVAAQKLRRSIDDHLGSVDAVRGVEVRVVSILAIRELMGGEAVVPAAVFPVVHVFTQNDDLYAVDGLKFVEFAQQNVGRRATRTTLGCEQLDNDGRAACLRGLRYAVGRDGEYSAKRRDDGEEAELRHKALPLGR